MPRKAKEWKHMQVELLKQITEYTNKDGKEVKGTNFYLRCGDTLIPIDVKYFGKKDKDGKELPDPQYSGRKNVMYAFADLLPERTK